MLLLLPALLLGFEAGKSWGVERSEYTDSVTGARVVELATKGASSNLYFHFSNFTSDNKYVIFANDRTGSMQLYRASVATGEIVQLTDEPGVSAASACPDPTSASRVYFVKGRAIQAIDIETFAQRTVAEVPAVGASQPTLSRDGKTMAFGFQAGASTWEIGVVDIPTGTYRRVLQQGFRIGHVQHSPTDPVIFYTWETSGYAPQRSWMVNVDGSGNRPFYANTEQSKWQTPLKEWMTHEAWVPATGQMTMIHDRHSIILVDKSGEWRTVTKGWYWHAASTMDGRRLIADDFDGKLWLIDVATGSTKLLATNVREAKQIHAHPSWDRTGRYVLFNRTQNGKQTLAVIDVAAWEASTR